MLASSLLDNNACPRSRRPPNTFFLKTSLTYHAIERINSIQQSSVGYHVIATGVIRGEVYSFVLTSGFAEQLAFGRAAAPDENRRERKVAHAARVGIPAILEFCAADARHRFVEGVAVLVGAFEGAVDAVICDGAISVIVQEN
jgi:hypothetical protein